jgi:carboxymethylenebutenolidase
MCYDTNARPPEPPGAAGQAAGQDIDLVSSDGTHFAAYFAQPGSGTTPRAGIVIYPDVRGLHQFYKELALRFAEQGIAAVAIDYFGRTAGMSPRDDSFEFMPHVQQIEFPYFLSDVTAALTYLQSQAPVPSFTVGFCMGGNLSLLTAAEDLPLSGAIALYAGMGRRFTGAPGFLPDRATSIRVPVLGLFGGADQGIPVETVEEFDQALREAAVDHEIVIYDGAPHSFFDRRFEEHADACADAWRRVLDFLGRVGVPA